MAGVVAVSICEGRQMTGFKDMIDELVSCAVCHDRQGRVRAQRMVLDAFASYATHKNDCVRRYYAYQDVKPIDCTCGLDSLTGGKP